MNSLPPPVLVASGPFAKVVEVGNNRCSARLDGGNAKDAGAAPRVGEFVILEGTSEALIGKISDVVMLVDDNGGGNCVHITLFASLDTNTGALSPGTREPPALGGRVYRPHPSVIRAVIEERSGVGHNNTPAVSLNLARPAQHADVDLSFPPERLLGRHCAILGTSGSGKSWSVARLIEECAQHRSKLILLDPTGEYEPLGGGTFHLHIGQTVRDNVQSLEAALPYTELTETDLVAIFRPTNGSQYLKLRSAIKTLKVLKHELKLAAEGTMAKAHRTKVMFENALDVWKDEISTPFNSFEISKLPLQLEFECVDPIRSQQEPHYWGGTNSYDHAQCVPLINRIEDILSSEELSVIFHPPQSPSVFDAINRFLADPNVPVLRISLEFLPTNHRVREIVANSVGRFILQKGRTGAFRSRPLVMILDEAHQCLSGRLSDMSLDFPLEAFNIIAKEGRKYGLTLCLATQRPRDIPDDVLSQMGAFIVHRLVSDADRSTVERASGALSKVMLDNLPALAPGEAFILGIDFPTPLHVRMIKPEAPPMSNGPNFQDMWLGGSK
jgi:hypothetical protein